jgi:long-chain acyl-CoA synthetase
VTLIPKTQLERHHDRDVRCFVNRPKDLWSMFATSARNYPNAEAVVHGEVRLTYAQLEARATLFSSQLTTYGAVAGDRIAIIMANQIDYLTALLAIWRLQAIAVPINIREGVDETRHALDKAGTCVIICDTAACGKAQQAAPGGAVVISSDSIDDCGRYACVPAQPADEDNPAAILFTSGTTGRPKGAVLSHFNIIHSCLHYRFALNLGTQERGILAVPASHVTGLVAIIATMMLDGGCTIILREFKASDFLNIAAHERMSFTLMVPAMYALCLKRPEFRARQLEHWKIAAFGGAPMPPVTLSAFLEQLPHLAFSNIYGATETASPTTIMPANETRQRLASVGKPVLCAEVRVVDDSGNDCADGCPGELWLGGPQVAAGYWNDDDATQREFIGRWWRSGDIGSRDSDGFIYLHDRSKDLVNRGGYKIFSVEVENILLELDAVAEVAIIPAHCPVLGERIHALVVLNADYTLDLSDVRSTVQARLADYKAPDILTIRSEALPRNANGKIMKSSLRAEYPH